MKKLVEYNEVLSGDAATAEVLGNGFVVDGQEVDPKQWVIDRIQYFLSLDRFKVTDEQAIEAYSKGAKDLSWRIAEDWQNAHKLHLDLIYLQQGSETLERESVEYSIRQAIVYYKAGRIAGIERYIDYAISFVVDVQDVAGSPIFEGTGLYEQATTLLDSMRKGEDLRFGIGNLWN